jgi:integrase
MPKYTLSNLYENITEDELLLMFKATEDETERLLVTILWFTGGRINEVLKLTRESFSIEPLTIKLIIPTLKAKTKSFRPQEREIVIQRTLKTSGLTSREFLIERIADYIKMVPPGVLFTFSDRHSRRIIMRLGLVGLKKAVCPNNFRHTALIRKSREGAGIEELMRFKGASDVRSVSPYLLSRPSNA